VPVAAPTLITSPTSSSSPQQPKPQIIASSPQTIPATAPPPAGSQQKVHF